MTDFVHLHLHTEYSLLDGACKIDDLMDHCRKNGIDTVCITDHGNMYGTLSFAEKAASAGLNYIIGCEFYLTDDINDKSPSNSKAEHLILLAKNKTGYRNLVRLNSIAFVDGYYYKPRIDYKLLKEYSDGVICLSACLAGGLSRRLLAGEYNSAKELALYLQGIFGDDFYVEIQNHGLADEVRVLPQLVNIAREIGAQIVATNDVHYLRREDSETQDVLMCIQMKKTLDDPNRLKFSSDQFYFKSGDEMAEIFSAYPSAIANTRAIADKVSEPAFNLDAKGYPIRDNSLIPGYAPPDGSSPEEYLRKLSYDGMRSRYGTLTKDQVERVDYELDVICRMGYAEYYLIVWDFINWSKQQKIPVGPGRGSGVGSVVAYAIGITDVDPLRYDLLFERFLNPDRVSMPDFDIDFCAERREETINYVRQKYNPENVCQIITFGTMAAKNSIKDVGRVMRVPYSETDRVTKVMDGKTSIANLLGRNIEAAQAECNAETDPDKKVELRNKLQDLKASQNPEFCEMYNNDETLHRVIDMALQIEGMPRQPGMHAAGVVICRKRIADNVPLSRNDQGITTQYVAKEIESLGMLKMDFLALVTLTDIKKCTDYIEENHGVSVDFQKIGYNDPGTYALISDGDTEGVFQLEAGGMKKFMRNLKPDGLEDLIAGISLYRPGPMRFIDSFCARKHGQESITYDCPQEERILKVTYGIPVYQEQVMQIFQYLGGFSLGEADLVRRAMGKKDKKTLLAQREKFVYGGISDTNGSVIKGCVNNGIDAEVATKIFNDMEGFSSYAFNKSHAAAYATLAYQTAWLKKYYCKEFMCAILNNRVSKIDEITKYIVYVKQIGLTVYPPDINKSRTYFTVENDGIRFGLSAMRGAGVGVVDEIIKERDERGEYTDFGDFMQRCASMLNKRMLEVLIYAGAFDGFGLRRSQLMEVYEEVYARASGLAKQKNNDQVSLFGDIIADDKLSVSYPDIPEFDIGEKLAREKEVLGVYVSGHPFEKYMYLMDTCSFNCSLMDDYLEDEDGNKTYNSIELDTQVTMGGIITGMRRTVTKKAGATMAIFNLEDVYGSVECVAFPSAYEKIKAELANDRVVIVRGKISLSDSDTFSIAVDDAKEVTETPSAKTAEPEKRAPKLWLNAESLSEEDFEDLLAMISNYPGETTCAVLREGKKFRVGSGVNYCRGLMAELLTYLDDTKIKYV